MERSITLRYAAKCHVCGNQVAAGERAYWNKTAARGKQVRHYSCSDLTTPEPSIKSDDPQSTYTADFLEVKEQFLNLTNGNQSFFSRSNAEIAGELNRMWEQKTAWVGCTIDDMRGWLENGYTVEGLADVNASLIQAKPRRRLRFQEEGDELHLDLAWSGVDSHFSEWEKRNQKPGLVVEIECAFSSKVKFDFIKPYILWVARMLQTFDENAIDVEALITNSVTSLFKGKAGQETKTRIRAKRAGEASDIAAWSALFSPGSFRQLVFTAKAMHGVAENLTVDNTLGFPKTSPRYDVEYDAESNTLYIRQPNGASEFPEFEMTQKLASIIREISG